MRECWIREGGVDVITLFSSRAPPRDLRSRSLLSSDWSPGVSH